MLTRAEFMPPQSTTVKADRRFGSDLADLRTVERARATSDALAGALDALSDFLQMPGYRQRRVVRPETLK